MQTPDWSHFRSAETDPSGPCCLLEKAFTTKDLPRNYIWVLGEHHAWRGPEEAEVSAQVRSYSREWLIARQRELKNKRDDLIQQQAKMKAAKERAMREREELQKNQLKDEEAVKQRIQANPFEMAKSLVKSAADLATGGTTDPSARMEICNTCPFKGDDQRCGKCGCFLPAKTRVAKSTCPIGRW